LFTENRDRLLNTNIARKFLGAILSDKAVTPLLSDKHFPIDGTLIEALASMKKLRAQGHGNQRAARG
jgi:hypothetical protein